MAAIHFVVDQSLVGGVPKPAKLWGQMNRLRIRLRRRCHLPTPVHTIPTRNGRIINQKNSLENELSQTVLKSIDEHELFS